MRCITSEPETVLQRIGTRPAMMATTVIIFGRTRSTAPTMMARRAQVLPRRRPVFPPAGGRTSSQAWSR